ncbi:SAUR-like auxin-responsive protein family [Actinidia rufa]|uniref:SAUR-like auxin-responsive protein family n=1 Tax=Actinidia rufa TaxID=165716 RepID=A0A7J0GKT5_9ERIC|nr:SAUR-like auxin-responsive protein family [Actinidia rufa]
MKIMKGKFLKVYLSKCQKMGIRVVPCLGCCQWPLWSLMQEEKYSTPRDVPKGHLVVYVGEDCKRHVIKITLLKHLLFRALLDQVRDQEYDIRAAPKLCIPCDENIFLTVVRDASTSPHHPRISLCLL